MRTVTVTLYASMRLRCFYALKKTFFGTGIKLPARATIYYFAVSSAAKAIGVITTPIFTRLLSGEGYGEYTLYISWLGFLSLFVTGLVAGAHGYRRLSSAGDKKEEYTAALLGISLSFCGIICALLFTFRRFLGINYDLIAVLSAQLACDVVLAISYMRGRYSYEYKRLCTSMLAQATLAPALAVALIRGAHLGYKGRIYALLTASVLVAVPAIFRIYKRGRSLYDARAWRESVRTSLPLLPHALSSALSLQIDRFIISAIMGSVALARYSVAHSVGAALSMATNALCAAVNPWIIRKLTRGEVDTVRAVTSGSLYLLCAAALAVIGIAPEAMRLLAPPEYSEATEAVLPIVLSSIPSLASSLGATGLIYSERGGRVSVAGGVSSVCAIAFGFLLIPRYGYLGAGLAQLISQSAGAILIFAFLYSQEDENLLPIKRVFSIFTATSALATVLYLLDGNLILRGFLLLIPLVFALYEIRRLSPLVLEK